MTNVPVRKWRERFRDYVMRNGIDLSDSEGNDIAFDNGEPMWNQKLTVYCEGNFVNVSVRRDGCVCELDEVHVGKWLRRFAAENGVFHIKVDIEVVHDSDGTYSIDASINFDPIVVHEKPETQNDYDSYWVIGDLDRYEFFGVKGDGFDDCPMSVNDPSAADQFESYDEAVEAMVNCDDVFEWVDEQPDPDAVRPLLVEVRTTVKAAKKN